MSDNNAISTRTQPTDLVNFKILTNGNALNGEYGIVSIETNKAFNKIASAKIVISDGDPAKQDFKISSSDDTLTPGNEIEIQMGYHTQAKTIFKGVVINHSIKSSKNKKSFLTIEAKDKAFLLSVGRNNQCFTEKSDADIIQAIAQKAGIKDVDIANTKVSFKEMVQYNSSNWDFILSRAEMNGMLVLTDDNKLVVQKPDTSGEAQKEIAYGMDVIEFESEINGHSQLHEIKSYAWNYKDQKVEESNEASIQFKETGNVKANDIADALKIKEYKMVHAGSIGDEELKEWSNAQLLKSRLAKVTGRIKLKGLNDLKPGQLVKLTGFSKRFNGNVLITSIRHSYDKSIWETEIHFGLSDKWFYKMPDVIERPASGMIPGVNGLQIGVVQQLENDPDNQDKIKIKLPMVDGQESIWARVATLDAGKERGSFFRPEIGDEVLVGFVNDDPRYPVVLGMLNSAAKPAPLKAADKNDEKGFITRSKMKFIFNDDKKSIHIETPGGNSIDISDDKKEIVIADQNRNKITMSSSGIEIESGKDISLKAASGNIQLQGINIESKAQAKFSGQGSASAEIQSSGVTVIKGSIVNIN